LDGRDLTVSSTENGLPIISRPRLLAGVLVAAEEGFEMNLLGLRLGVDPLGPALKLPAVAGSGCIVYRPSVPAVHKSARA
jgi:hypothetical protein